MELLPHRTYGQYWSVSKLQPTTTYLFRHVYTCTGGSHTYNSEVATGTTTSTFQGCVDGTCPDKRQRRWLT